jgi:hypothetical protein
MKERWQKSQERTFWGSLTNFLSIFTAIFGRRFRGSRRMAIESPRPAPPDRRDGKYTRKARGSNPAQRRLRQRAQISHAARIAAAETPHERWERTWQRHQTPNDRRGALYDVLVDACDMISREGGRREAA